MLDVQHSSHMSNRASIEFIRSRRGLGLSSLIWLAVIGSAALAAWFKTSDIQALIPIIIVGAIPALFTFLVMPFLRKDWAQIAIIFVWIALAMSACLSLGFFPSALLFVCAPAAASLFAREKVVESMALAGVSAIGVYYMQYNGYGPDDILSQNQKVWAQHTLVIAFLIFTLSTLFAASNQSSVYKPDYVDNEQDLKDKGEDISDVELTGDQTIIPESTFGSNLSSQEAPFDPSLTQLASSSTPAMNAGLSADMDWISYYPGSALKLDANGLVISATEAAKKLFVLADADMGQVSLDKIGVAKDEARAALMQSFEDALSTQNSQHVLTQSVLPHMQNEMHLTLDFVPTSTGYVYAFVSPQRDPDSDMETLKRSYDFAQKEAENKTLFFAGVSHELRTPLNAIIGFSDMMRSRLFGPLPGKYAEYADLIHESGQHMLDLIGDVLDLSKINVGKYELHLDEFNSVDVIRSSIKMLQPAADAGSVQINTQITHIGPLIIQADRKAVRQILLNLLSNAIKFSPKGGHVTVSADLDGQNLVLSVKDNGLGMSASELKKIGEPFTQTSSSQLVETRGSGLGLSLVKSLTDMHKGEFEISSKRSFGTTVKITLPQTQNGNATVNPTVQVTSSDQLQETSYSSELLLDTPLNP